MVGGNDSDEKYIPVKRTVKVTQNGSQFIMRIPMNLVEALELKDGDKLELRTQENPKEFVARVVSDGAKNE